MNPFDLIKKGLSGIIEKGKQSIIPKSNAQLGITDQSKLGIARNTIMGLPKAVADTPQRLKEFFLYDTGFEQELKSKTPVDYLKLPATTKLKGATQVATRTVADLSRLGAMGMEKAASFNTPLNPYRAYQNTIDKFVQTKTGGLLAGILPRAEQFAQPKTLDEALAFRGAEALSFLPVGSTKSIKPVSKVLSKIDDPILVARELKTNFKFSDNVINEYAPMIAKEKNEERIAKTITEMYAQNNPEALVAQLKKESSDYQKRLVQNKQGAVAKRDAMKTSAIIRKIEGKPTSLEIDETIKQLYSNYKVRATAEDAINYMRANALKEGAQRVFKKIPERSERVISKIDEVTENKKIATDLSIETIENRIKSSPGSQLKKFMSRKEGEFLDFDTRTLGMARSRSDSAKIQNTIERNRKISDIGTNYGLDLDGNPDLIRDIIAQYDADLKRLKELKAERKELRTIKPVNPPVANISEAESLERLAEQSSYTLSPTGVKNIQRVNRSREAQVNAYKDALNLPDNIVKKIVGRRDFRQMTEPQYQDFLKELVARGEYEKRMLVQRNIVEDTIRSKELKKVENFRKVMKLPSIKNMSMSQLKQFDEAMNSFKVGDEFLSVRQLETVKNTNLENVRTYREARESLAKELDVSVDELGDIRFKGADKIKYDAALARTNPFAKYAVEEVHGALLNAEAKVFDIKKEVNNLISDARKSRKRGLFDRLVPTDTRIFNWLEADSANKIKLAETMTEAELKAATRIREMFADARDYLVQTEVLKKYRNDYVTYLRRGFLEAWKKDGIMQGFKEIFEANKFDPQSFSAIDNATGEILALEKFFKFSVRRTGKVKPTENVADAVLTYMGNLEKKKAFDQIIPKIDIYAASLDKMDEGVRNFIKQWLNTKKGKVTKGLVDYGSKADWAIRTGVALTRLKDLGASISIGVASSIGEIVGNYLGLGARKIVLGNARALTKDGRKFLKNYENFVGESFFSKLADQSKNIKDNFLETAFSLFSQATRRANAEFLLGSITKEELKSGTLSTKRLAEIKIKMARWRVAENMTSIVGARAEGKVFTQYKSWAVPMLSSALDDIGAVVKVLRGKQSMKEFLKSQQGQEIPRILMTAFASVMVYSYFSELKDKKDRTFAEEIAFKSAREVMTLYQGLTPSLWFSTPRLLTFLKELGDLGDKIIKLDGPGSVKDVTKIVTPSAVRQFMPKDNQKTGAEKEWERISKLPTKEEKIAELNLIKSADKDLANRIKQVIKDENMGLTDEDKMIRELGVKDKERASFIYNKAKKLETKEEKLAYLKDLQKKEIITDEVKKQIQGMFSGSESVKVDRGTVSTFLTWFKALKTDPTNAIRAIGKEKLGVVEGNLVELQRDFGEEYLNEDGTLNDKGGAEIKRRLAEKLGIPISEIPKLNREHIVPVSAGGSNSFSNMQLIPEALHKSYTTWDTKAGNAVKNGTMTRKEVTEIAIKLKVDKSITVEEALNMLK
jgi:hypothetical protein